MVKYIAVTSRCLLTKFCIILCVATVAKNASLSLQEQEQYKSLIEGQGLYSPDDGIEILTAHNYKSELYNKDHAWVIEFYNSWCGFCQRFAPSWKALAADTRAWRDLIKIGAIDCSDDDNNQICRDFEIMSYPTVLYFHENYKEDPSNLGLKVEKGEDMQGHKQYIILTLQSEQANGRGKMYPDLLHTHSSSISEIRNSVSSNNKYIFVILQNDRSYFGPETILDFHSVKEIAVKYAVNTNTKLLSAVAISDADLPAVFVISDNNSTSILGKNFKSKVEIEEAIKDYLKPKNIQLPDTEPKKTIFTGKWIQAEVPDMSAILQEREQHALMQKVKRMGDAVFQVDLETALRYSLKHEVTSASEITGDKLDALKSYLKVLAKYFPLGPRGQVLLADLRDLAVTSDSTFKTAEMRALVLEAAKDESQVYSSSPNWLGCKGSSPGHRGYPCGVWKMFHYMTVNAAEVNGNKTDTPREVLDAMHGYIKHFFGCADCSRHFQEMARRKHLRNVSSYHSSILWLWMAHNEVNRRLAGDETEDPEYPKYQFPKKERCPQCKNIDDTWNYVEVLNYLKQMYGSANVRYLESDTRIIHSGLEGPTTTSGATSIFKTIDTTEIPEKDVLVRRLGESLIFDEAS